MEEDVENVIQTMISSINEVILGENLTSLRAIPMNVNVFYENSKLEGTVALGKYDETFVASKVKIKNGNGPEREYPAIDVMENGEVVLEKLGLNVGAAGAKKLTGEIIIQQIDELSNEYIPYHQFKPEDSNRKEKQQSLINHLEIYTSQGWSPIQRVIRHKTKKKIYRIRSGLCKYMDICPMGIMYSKLLLKVMI